MRRLLLILVPLALLSWLWRVGAIDAAQQVQAPALVQQAPAAQAPVVLNQAPAAKASKFAGSETCALCHADLAKSFSSNPHSELALMHGGKGTTCESCHGPGQAHVDSGGDPTKILQLSKMSAKQIDTTCLGCHEDAHPNFLRSDHAKAGVSCTSCHSIHGLAPVTIPAKAPVASAAKKSESLTRFFRAMKPDASITDPLQWTAASVAMPGQNPHLLKASQPQLCYSCHTDVKSAFAQPFHHKVDEGLMSCSDCHDSHGTFQAKQLKSSADQNAVCVKCHAETAGPFVYEHPVVKTGGCVSCHPPHGSPNARLLNIANVNTMCLQCHSSINLTAFPNTPSEQGGPVHNQATQYVACTNCHTQIHGSNAAYNFFR